jgi:acetylornithine/succinyldiaminopimelate/putrescine aminotransferase
MYALDNGLILNLRHGTIMRIFPALTIDSTMLNEGFSLLEEACYVAVEAY